MSFAADCPACTSGDHERHDRDWNITPGLIGGSSCDCSGDCAERAKAGAEKFWANLTASTCPATNGCACERPQGHAGHHKCRHGHWLNRDDEAPR